MPGPGNYTGPATGQGVVNITPPESCFIVDMREITYFNGTTVLTSSDATIRANAGISGAWNPALWPYNAAGGSNYTKSRGTLFRVYGFRQEEYDDNIGIPEVAWSITLNQWLGTGKMFPVRKDLTTGLGRAQYFIEIGNELSDPTPVGNGRPGAIFVCPSQLINYLIDQRTPGSGAGTGTDNAGGDGLLPSAPDDPGIGAVSSFYQPSPQSGSLGGAEKNVPGLLLNYQASLIDIPLVRRNEMDSLGLTVAPFRDQEGRPATQGFTGYIGMQVAGRGNATFREFVDVQIIFTDDSAGTATDDRLTHYRGGFHTVKNLYTAGAPTCTYYDYNPATGALRMNDVWEATHFGGAWGPACGTAEPSTNKKQREQFAVAYNAAHRLSAVSTDDDTTRNFFGEIIPYVLIPGAMPFTTFTQGGWGAAPSGNNPGALLANNFNIVYPNGSVTIGIGRTQTFTSAKAIETALPGGSTAGPITTSSVNPTTINVLGGQLLAAQLSLNFSQYVTRPGLGTQVIQKGPFKGKTMNQLMLIAHTAYGGGALPSGITYADINTALTNFNQNYDNGTVNKGFLK